MVYKFYDIADVGKSYAEYLKRTISYNEVLKDELIIHLAKIYEEDNNAFQVFSDFAFMDTGFHDMDNNCLFAYFSPNRNKEAKQKWALQSFKTEAQIEELCNPVTEEEPEPEPEKPVKKNYYS